MRRAWSTRSSISSRSKARSSCRRDSSRCASACGWRRRAARRSSRRCPGAMRSCARAPAEHSGRRLRLKSAPRPPILRAWKRLPPTTSRSNARSTSPRPRPARCAN
ncbi:hypothetical protein FQY83_12335 [Luteimonas marina]|uniref:Uncharacterized protein n=1 Tax=Luteimonas marina TaxID=488485 RepID=A0A5C5U032_9GAMM|nr:hypothetical protein FQY83_12335 [Luteimonas marina]